MPFLVSTALRLELGHFAHRHTVTFPASTKLRHDNISNLSLLEGGGISVNPISLSPSHPHHYHLPPSLLETLEEGEEGWAGQAEAWFVTGQFAGLPFLPGTGHDRDSLSHSPFSLSLWEEFPTTSTWGQGLGAGTDLLLWQLHFETCFCLAWAIGHGGRGRHWHACCTAATTTTCPPPCTATQSAGTLAPHCHFHFLFQLHLSLPPTGKKLIQKKNFHA